MASRFDQFKVPITGDPPIPGRPGQTISTGADVLLSAAAGGGEGLHAIPGQLGDTKSFFSGANNAVRGWLGLDPISPEVQAGFDNPGKALGLPNIEPPTTADLTKFTGYEKIAHVPQTPEGKFAKSATSTAAQSVFGGPRAVVMGAAAGLGSEAAGQATEGTWAEPIARIIGGLGTGVGANAIVNAYREHRPRLPEAPTQEMLDTTADFGFEFARQLDVEYDGNAFAQALTDVQDNLYQRGTRDFLAPRAYRVMEQMRERAEGGALNISDLHADRRALQTAARDFTNPTEQAAAMQAIALIDRFIRNPDPATVLRGDARAAADIWGDAMDNYAGAMRSLRLQNAEEATLRQGRATHSGLNIDNKLRQKAAWITNPEYPARRAGYSEAEVAMLNDLADGTPGRNTLRWASKMLGGGGGLGQAAAAFFAGTGSGQPMNVASAIALGTIGAGRSLTGLANRIAHNNWRTVDEATRRRTPLGGQMPLANIPVTQMTIPEILAATTGPLRDDQQQTPRLDRGGQAAVINALIPR